MKTEQMVTKATLEYDLWLQLVVATVQDATYMTYAEAFEYSVDDSDRAYAKFMTYREYAEVVIRDWLEDDWWEQEVPDGVEG